MSEQMTTPEAESSLSVDQAADAIHNLFHPKETKKVQPSTDKEKTATSEDSQEQPEETDVEESDDKSDQPEAEVEAEEQDEEEFSIGGETVKASTLKEWKESGLRLQDYTKKTQELANSRREWEQTRAQEEAKFRGEWTQKLAMFGDIAIDSLKQFEKVNWDDLRENDPFGYHTQWADYQRAKEQAMSAQREIQRALEEERTLTAQRKQQIIQEQLPLVTKMIPELADAAKAPVIIGQMAEYLTSLGFSPEEQDAITSAREMKIIYDASRYNSIRNKAKTVEDKKIVHVTKVVKPGSPQSNKEIRTERSAQRDQSDYNRLRKTGSVNDAAALIARRLKG